MSALNINRLPLHLKADVRRVILRPRNLAGSFARFIERFEKLTEKQLEEEWQTTLRLFEKRHRNFEERVMKNARRSISEYNIEYDFTPLQMKVLGAYTSMEYSIQAAALFNPSIVPIGNNADGWKFVMSLRAVGEGHISSIEFKEGFYSTGEGVKIVSEDNWRTPADVVKEEDNYYVATFGDNVPIGERVLFPKTSSESNGMEDLRLVTFDDGSSREILGTYTAYDGHNIQSKLLRTEDFKTFTVYRLIGDAIKGKGIAIFPRKINGKYAAIGRQDGVSLTIMYSESLINWEDSKPLFGPSYGHDLTQIGNCGSPIETEAGWLLPTHGVGTIRRYTLGVALLDLEDPSKVLKYLEIPFMEPDDFEREGYVPNVLYTCGWMKAGNELLIPYAMSDTTCGFATTSISELLNLLTK